MVQLQDEILKFFKESSTDENKEDLQEASFKDISTAADNIKTDEFKKYVADFTKFCEDALKFMSQSVNIIKETENKAKEVKNLRNRNDSKDELIHNLKRSYALMEQAESDMKLAKKSFSHINEEFGKLNKAIKEVKYHLYNKNAWFNRVFRFWN